MSASPEFVDYVHELLRPLGDLKGARFFGGYGLKYGTRQFAMIMGNTLYFCVDATSRPAFEARGMQPFSYTTKKGRVLVRKYYSAPEELFEDPKQLVRWAKQAIAAAQGA